MGTELGVFDFQAVAFGALGWGEGSLFFAGNEVKLVRAQAVRQECGIVTFLGDA